MQFTDNITTIIGIILAIASLIVAIVRGICHCYQIDGRAAIRNHVQLQRYVASQKPAETQPEAVVTERRANVETVV